MALVDANVILRYLLNDIADQAQMAREAIEAGAAVEIEIIAEVVYVLQGVYEVPRREISRVLGDLCPNLACSRLDILIEALEAYGSTSLDFVDCVLLATAKLGHADVLTFDRKLASAIERLPGKHA